MKLLQLWFSVVCLLGLVGTACAEVAVASAPTELSATASWTIPVTRENGKKLEVTELQGYRLYSVSGEGNARTYELLAEVAGGGVTKHVLKAPMPVAGSCFVRRLVVTALADVESGKSAEALWQFCPPSAPGSLMVSPQVVYINR